MFLYSHYKEGHGAILGDDMGLGKTVQVFLISLITF
jgi:SNF2 family DNA or RNA helicase